MKKTICFGLMIVILISISTPSSAKFIIEPSVSVREKYVDNIFLSRDNREYDFISEIFPAITLKSTPIQSLDIILDYGFNFRFYSRNSDLNDTSISETQHINFQAEIRPLNRIFINISDEYKRIPIDIRDQLAFENTFVNLTDRNIFTISPYIQLPLTSSISTTIGYSYSNIWYRSDVGNASENHSAFFTLEKQFSPRINTALKYSYIAYRVDKVENFNRDYDKHQGSAAVTYQVTPNFLVKVESGIAKYDYKAGRDETAPTWIIDADYTVTERMSLGAGYESYFYDSVLFGVVENRRFNIRFNTGKTTNLTINPYYSTEKYFNLNREDAITGTDVYISRKLTKKLNVSLQGLWERQKFLPEDETVYRHSVGSTVVYSLSPHIITSIGYNYNNKNSNIDANDFYNNVTWVQLRVTF